MSKYFSFYNLAPDRSRELLSLPGQNASGDLVLHGKNVGEVAIKSIRRASFEPEVHHHSLYSITSSAPASSDCGTLRPSAFAVFRLITSSNLVGWITGQIGRFRQR